MKTGGKPREALARAWITRAAERASAGLARDGVDVKRLRRRGFETAALDANVLARHDRRYSLELPFGGVEDQMQSGRCWLFAPVVLEIDGLPEGGRGLVEPAQSLVHQAQIVVRARIVGHQLHARRNCSPACAHLPLSR